jgi:pentatricopeptide repeat protein
MWFNAMINGFAGWGEVEYVRRMFDQIPCSNVVSWTRMIDRYTASKRRLLLFSAR